MAERKKKASKIKEELTMAVRNGRWNAITTQRHAIKAFQTHLHFEPVGVVAFSNKFLPATAELPGGSPNSCSVCNIRSSRGSEVLCRVIMEEQQLQITPMPMSPSTQPCDPEEELQRMQLVPPRLKSNKLLSKQLSMSETPRDVAWKRRRRQILRQVSRKNAMTDSEDITDEDLNELKGSIELGFGFNEEEGHSLCNTLPALDLYFAVSRQLSSSPVSTPRSRHSVSSLGDRSSSFDSPKSDSDSWKICSPGDDPQQVKTKLRHWAQAVACAVMQSL